MKDKVLSLVEKLWILALAPLGIWMRDSLTFWRIFAVVGWTIVALGWYKREWLLSLCRRAEYREHDKEIFLESDEIFSEKDWRSFHYDLAVKRGEDRDLFHKIMRYLEFFDAEQNKYLLPQLRRLNDKLLCSLDDLTDFIANHFYPDANRLGEGVLEPRLGEHYSEENINKYSAILEQLRELTTEVDQSNRRYHRAINRLLPDAREVARQASGGRADHDIGQFEEQNDEDSNRG